LSFSPVGGPLIEEGGVGGTGTDGGVYDGVEAEVDGVVDMEGPGPYAEEGGVLSLNVGGVVSVG